MLTDYQLKYIDSLIERSRTNKRINSSEIEKITPKESEDFESVLLMFEDEGITIIHDTDLDSEINYYSDQNKNNLMDNQSIDIDETETAKMIRGIQSDLVTSYLNEISENSLLSVQEEIELSKLVQNGLLAKAKLDAKKKKGVLGLQEEQELIEKINKGNEAKESIFNANTRLVVSIAKRYMNRGMELSDLIQDGNFGLLKSIDKFDYSLGYRMSTYFTYWIRQSIMRGIADKGRSIRLPVHIVDELNRLGIKERSLAIKLGRTPTNEELAKEMGITTNKLTKLLLNRNKITSLDTTIGDEDDSTIGELVVDENTMTAYDYTKEEEFKAMVKTAMNRLDEKEQNVIQYRYGFVDGKVYTLEQVGSIMGVTRERIRQIEVKALHKLRNYLSIYQ